MIFLKGLFVGLVFCAPFGPVGVLCIRRFLLNGRLIGFFSVLGASFTDLLYCSIAGFGIVYISEFVHRQEKAIELTGSLILIWIGILLLNKALHPCQKKANVSGSLEAFSSIFILTLAHPAPILIFTASYIALGIQGWDKAPFSSFMFVTGTFIGSALWALIFFTLAGLLQFHKIKLNHRMINRVAGSFTLSCGIGLCLWTFLKML